MKERTPKFILLLAVSLVLAACNSGGNDSIEKSIAGEKTVSGRIEGGLRVLTFDPAQKNQDFVIFRGDYVRPEVVGGGTLHLVSSDLKVDAQYPAPEGQKGYFKVPKVGTFSYTAGDLSGVIEAVNYSASSYREVGAKEAFELIANIDPLILDVRTKREFDAGHIAGSVLIPVQVLQKRIDELDQYKERPVFVYCRSGNRSTVASRMLTARGFDQVINLRHGVNDWRQSGYELVK